MPAFMQKCLRHRYMVRFYDIHIFHIAPAIVVTNASGHAAPSMRCSPVVKLHMLSQLQSAAKEFDDAHHVIQRARNDSSF